MKIGEKMFTIVLIGAIIVIFASGIIWAYGWKDIKKRLKILMKK